MNSVKTIETTLRGAQIMKQAADLVGCSNVIVARLIIAGIKEKIRELEKFIDTAEVEK